MSRATITTRPPGRSARLISQLFGAALLLNGCGAADGREATEYLASAGQSSDPGVQAVVDPARSQSYTHVFRRAEIIDPMGLQQPVVAMRLLVPFDWTLEQDLRWHLDPACSLNPILQWARVRSPDGSVQIEFFPRLTWLWSANETVRSYSQPQRSPSACLPPMPPKDANAVLAEVALPFHRRDIGSPRVRSSVPLPAVASDMRQLMTGILGPMLSQWPMYFDAALYTVDYELVGEPFEEQFYVVVSQSGLADPNPYSVAYSISAIESLYAMRAPRGTLERWSPVFNTIIMSVTVDPRWGAAVDDYLLRTLAGIQQTGSEIAEIVRRTGQQRQQIMDRTNESWIRNMRGVELWQDPNTGEVLEFDIGWDRVFTRGDGTYLVTDDVQYDPIRAGALNDGRDHLWYRLERRAPGWRRSGRVSGPTCGGCAPGTRSSGRSNRWSELGERPTRRSRTPQPRARSRRSRRRGDRPPPPAQRSRFDPHRVRPR